MKQKSVNTTNAGNDKLLLLTYVSGNINGCDFTASGRGEANLRTGTTESHLAFSAFPENFTPRYGKSWKCNHHPRVALERDGGTNLFSVCGGNYDVRQVIRYPDNYVLYSSSTVRNIDHATQVVITRIDGLCVCPGEIAKETPYTESFCPAGAGKAIFRGEKTFIFRDGKQATITWEGDILFVDRNAQLKSEQIVSYEFLRPVRFLRKRRTYDKRMAVSISPYK